MKRRSIVGIYEAKTNFSKLVREAADGSEVVISNGGKPIAKIVGYSPDVPVRKPGLLAGKVVIKRGFDDLPQGFEEYAD
jgi:prevent-host-death family protein